MSHQTTAHMPKHHLTGFAPLFLLLGLAHACTVGEPSIGAANSSIYLNNELCSGYGGPADCTAMLAATQSTEDSSCAIALDAEHKWPVGGSLNHCHGWAWTDTSGRVHYNSARNIQCSRDGPSMTYLQYPNTLNCSGIGHPKKHSLNQCTQGVRPSRLYDRATDLSCCVPSEEDGVNVIEEATFPADTVDNALQNVWDTSRDARVEVIRFGVYKDKECNQPMMGNDSFAEMTVETCFVGTYTDPAGKKQTNANANFNCADGSVTWTQFPGSDSCHPTSGSLCINATLTNKCTAVQTHMGTTYQRLEQYSGCSARYTGPRCPP